MAVERLTRGIERSRVNYGSTRIGFFDNRESKWCEHLVDGVRPALVTSVGCAADDLLIALYDVGR